MDKKKSTSFLSSLLALFSLLFASFFWKNNILLTLAMVVISVVFLYLKKSKTEFKLFIFCSLFGATAEMLAIYFGAWNYSNPNIINIPSWLPILWGMAGVFMYRVGKKFE